MTHKGIDYNTDRPKLRMMEYGRHIQELVDHCMQLTDRRKRQVCAEGIIEKMALMHRAKKNMPGFKQKLWDHLAIMSNFQLDIDYPYDISTAHSVSVPPQPVPYNKHRIPGRHYGAIVFEMLEILRDMKPGSERDRLVQMIGNQMKRDVMTYGNSQPDNDRIVSDIAFFTDGKVQVDLNKIKFDYIKMEDKKPATPQKPKKRKK